MKAKIIFSLIFTISFSFFSQEKKVQKTSNKGKFFFYWGWNRASYSNSDIRLFGENYDFTLQDVKAKDRMTPFSFNDYFNITRITIPQTNYRIGYFFKDNYTISVGVDHMKYVMTAGQKVTIDGQINAGNVFDGVYNNDEIILSEDFLRFEHTDGLNYVNLEVRRFDEVGQYIGLSTENFQINLTEGIGAGIVVPRTNASLFNQERWDEFHLSGWGVSAVAGINFTFFKYFFIQSDLKFGYIDMSDIRTSANTNDRASQSFTFFQKTFLFGARFNIFK